MAKLQKVRTRKKPRETVLVEDGWQAKRYDKGWNISSPAGYGYRFEFPLNQPECRNLLFLMCAAHAEGRDRVQKSLQDAIGL